MPVAPYTWQPGDFLTASRLNGELYRYAGMPFTPNGTGFHAARPIYKASQLGSTTVFTSGAWNPQGSSSVTDLFCITADTAAMFGRRMDPRQTGTVALSVSGSGGTVASAGGLGLVTAFSTLNQGTGVVRSGLGLASGTGPSITGTAQQANSNGQNTCPWSMDIMDLNGGALTGFFLSSVTGPQLQIPQNDGSGQSNRLSAIWSSVYPANGTTVAALPSLQSTYTSSTPALTDTLLNANIAALFNLLNMPPLLRVAATGTTSVPTSTATVVALPAATYDTYGGWSNTTDTYTVPLSGLYLVYGCVPYDNTGATALIKTGVQVNGTNFWGPTQPITGGQKSAAAKVQVFDLQAGDTIRLLAFQTTGATQTTSSADNPLLLALYLGALGAPAFTPVLPDVTYLYQAGTPQANVPGILNAHLANDLQFLLHRPYLLSYQTVAQTGLTTGAASTVTMDTVSGLIHASAGDPYSGWSSANHNYVAPVSGWYLAVQENFLAQPSSTTGTVAALFHESSSGAVGSDWYQQACIPPGVGNGGSAAVGIYYLRAGDSITPQVELTAGPATYATQALSGSFPHFELIWIGN